MYFFIQKYLIFYRIWGIIIAKIKVFEVKNDHCFKAYGRKALRNDENRI